MANVRLESNGASINVNEFFAAEAANLSFASTAKMRGGSDEKTRLSAERQRKADNYFNRAGRGASEEMPFPVMHPGAIFPGYERAKQRFEESVDPPKPSLGGNPTPFDENGRPSLYQPGRKPENHFANSTGFVRPPRARQNRGGRALRSHVPAANARRGPMTTTTQRSVPPPMQSRSRMYAAAHSRPLVHTTVRNMTPKADKAHGGLAASRYTPIHLRIARGEHKIEVEPKTEPKAEVKADVAAVDVEVEMQEAPVDAVQEEIKWVGSLESDESFASF